MGRAVQEVLCRGRGKEREKVALFTSDVTEESIRRERASARELRNTAWWKRKCAAGRCYYCNSQVHPKELTMDHIVPLIRGGRSGKGNLVPACKECNNKKKHMLPVEWEEYLHGLDVRHADL